MGGTGLATRAPFCSLPVSAYLEQGSVERQHDRVCRGATHGPSLLRAWHGDWEGMQGVVDVDGVALGRALPAGAADAEIAEVLLVQQRGEGHEAGGRDAIIIADQDVRAQWGHCERGGPPGPLFRLGN